ncbi:hypothetical protein RKD20_000611 [Streptomyces sp. SLBN-8D4]|jgi:hypothetical protein
MVTHTQQPFTARSWQPLSHDRQGRPVDFAESLERGHATFRLHGTKLRGRYALTRFREDNWLLVKTAEARARGHGTPNPRRARSVRTGRTLAQVAAEEN